MRIDQLRLALLHYGVHPKRFGQVEHGYRNVSLACHTEAGAYNIIVYERGRQTAEHINLINRLGVALAGSGLPVRRPADERLLRLRQKTLTRYAALYHYLPGKTIPWEAYTMKHLKLLGWAMADFHRAGRGIALTGLPEVEVTCVTQCQKMREYFSQAGLRGALHSKLKLDVDAGVFHTFEAFFAATAALSGRQVLHMDFVRGNILFDRAKTSDRWQMGGVALTGILDLEKAALGHPLFDIARTLAFLLADCSQKTEAQIRKYFLVSGYGKRGESPVKSLSVTLPSQVKCNVLETAMEFFWLYDFYKFLRSNPYESLPKNYHFCRTRDILLEKNLLHYI